MSVVTQNASIVDGLTLSLDVANTKSWPGSGSTWYDLSENKINFTLTGTLNYTTLGGSPCFGFNSSMYWTSTTADAQKTDYRYGATIEMWLYCQTKAARHTVFEKNGNAHSSYEQEIAMTWETGNDISCYRAFNSYDYGSSGSLTNNAWNHVVFSMYPHLSNCYWYVNGVSVGNYTQRALQLPAQANAIMIGNGYSGIVDTGGVAVVRTYSKIFDQADAIQNFNASRRRFGL